jgi:hypothetical protein
MGQEFLVISSHVGKNPEKVGGSFIFDETHRLAERGARSMVPFLGEEVASKTLSVQSSYEKLTSYKRTFLVPMRQLAFFL